MALTHTPRAEPLRAGVDLELCASLLHPSNAHVPPLTGDHKTSPYEKNGIKGTKRLRINKSSHNYPVYFALKSSLISELIWWRATVVTRRGNTLHYMKHVTQTCYF